MSASSSRPNPILLVTVAIIVIVAVVFGFTKMGSGDDDAAEGGKGAKNSSKSSGRAGSARSGFQDGRHSGKSDGKTDEERKIGEGVGAGGAVARAGSGDPVESVRMLSLSAREELMELRARFATEYDDPEERKAFGLRLAEVKEPNARAQLLRERTKEMRAARVAADARKTPENLAREKQLVSLMQVEGMRRMADQIIENPDLQAEGEAMRGTLDDFVQGYDRFEGDEFHRNFNDLRRVLNDLRRRNQGFVNPNAPQPPGSQGS